MSQIKTAAPGGGRKMFLTSPFIDQAFALRTQIGSDMTIFRQLRVLNSCVFLSPRYRPAHDRRHIPRGIGKIHVGLNSQSLRVRRKLPSFFSVDSHGRTVWLRSGCDHGFQHEILVLELCFAFAWNAARTLVVSLRTVQWILIGRFTTVFHSRDFDAVLGLNYFEGRIGFAAGGRLSSLSQVLARVVHPLGRQPSID